MFRYLRERTFAFCGAYTMVAFYNTAQNELSGPDGHVVPEKLKVAAQQRSWLPHWISTPPPPKPLARLSDDVRWYIVEYDVQTALAMGLIIMAGGWCSLLGAATAVVLECNEDGPQNYEDLKHRLFAEATELRKLQQQPPQ